jgi:hypothetical protein
MIDIVKKHLLVFVIEINKFEYRILSVENDKFWIWEAIFFIDIWISKDIYHSITKVICLNSMKCHAHIVFITWKKFPFSYLCNRQMMLLFIYLHDGQNLKGHHACITCIPHMWKRQ